MGARMKKIPTEKEIAEILERGTAEIIGKEDLLARLRSGKPIRVKLGIDPTSPYIHIGRAATLLKLRDLERMGHTIVLIIGDFTGVIGDTSDKETERPMLTPVQVKQNMRTYFSQAGKIITIKKAEAKKNSSWLSKLRYADIGKHADAFSVADFIARDNIKKRLDNGLRVSLRELLYPLMQGYDSVAVRADLEVGGTDQRFNMLAGRTLQTKCGQKPQAVMTLNLLLGTDGRKMSSSWGNTINITDSANDMYGKVMSLRDDAIIPYFVSITRAPMVDVRTMETQMKTGALNPRDAKMRLAREITALFHSEKKARDAERAFIKTFQKKEIPDETETYKMTDGQTLAHILVAAGITTSTGAAQRLAEGRAIKDLDTGETITNARAPAKKGVYKIGKRRFLKIM